MISLLFRALSIVFSSTTVSKAFISFLTVSLLYGPTLTSIYDCWKNHSFDYRTFAGQVMSLLFNVLSRFVMAFPGGSEVKASACNAGDLGSIPGSGRSPGEGNGTPLQYSCLENPMDGGAWWATVHGVAKSQTQLSDFTHSLTKFVIACLPRSKHLLISGMGRWM